MTGFLFPFKGPVHSMTSHRQEFETTRSKIPKLPVAEFNRITKSAGTIATQAVFKQPFFEQKVFLYVKMVFSDKNCQQISKLQRSIAT